LQGRDVYPEEFRGDRDPSLCSGFQEKLRSGLRKKPLSVIRFCFSSQLASQLQWTG
jgi:hypothetical protein